MRTTAELREAIIEFVEQGDGSFADIAALCCEILVLQVAAQQRAHYERHAAEYLLVAAAFRLTEALAFALHI